MASLLLGKGAGPSHKADYLDTPLHLACLLGHGAVVALLLDNAADPCALDEDGKVCVTWLGRWWVALPACALDCCMGAHALDS